MPRIIATTREPVYNAKGQLTGHLVHTDSVAETPPRAAAPLRTAQACGRCGQSGCRCTTTPPSTQAQADADWMPRTILFPQGKDTPAPPMSTEMRAMKTAQAQWDTVFNNCRTHMRYTGHSDDLRACSTPQLLSVFARLERGEVIDGVVDPVMAAWKPRGLLDQYPRKP